MCELDKPEKPQKPLTNIQTWGLDDENMPEPTDDQLLEELLIEEENEDFEELDNGS